MEKDIVTGTSENSAYNLRETQARQWVQEEFWIGRSSVVSRAQLEQDRARLDAWLLRGVEDVERRTGDYDFLMEMTASKALNCFGESAEEKAKKEQARVIALNESRAKRREEERLLAEQLHHPVTRMSIFFKNPTSMNISEQNSVVGDSQADLESLPSGSASVVNELVRMENEKDDALLRADNVAETIFEGNPYTQRANVYERMWVLVSEENPVWKVCCSVFSEFRKEAKEAHRQLAACKNCASIFFPFFPDEYHMHQISAKFKSCLDPRTSEGDCESLPQRALVGLAQEAKAYKKEGDEEFIKLPRMVKGTRGHRAVVKYGRFELCENNNVSCESNSKKTFQARNLAVGVLELVIQLHFRIPISSKLLKPNHHGAGFADYFQHYISFVPEFSDDILFRCFLIEFGQHVRRTIKFDPGFKFNSNWWSGPCISPASTFVESGSVGRLVTLDKHGLVQLAKSLAEGTCRVVDDFFHDGKNREFIVRATVEKEVELLNYLQQIPPGLENEKVENERLPILKPLEVGTNPEVTLVEMSKRVSKTKLSKRPPDLDDDEVREMERKRKNKADSRARKKAEAARSTSRLYSPRRKVMVRRK